MADYVTVEGARVGVLMGSASDWPVMEKVGLKVCVADGHPLLAKRANYVTTINGGHGAVREVCDLILQARNELDVHKGLSI